jgi:hypothetical protein
MVRYINWRNDQLDWADHIIQHLGLTLPSSQRIRTWFKTEWAHVHAKIYDRFEECYKAVLDAKVFEDPEPGLGPKWMRPQEYVAAALVLTCKGSQDLKSKISQVFEIKEHLIREQVEEVIRAAPVQEAAKTFFAKVGRKLRDISPAKSKRRRTLLSPPSSPPAADRRPSRTPDLRPSQRKSEDLGSPSKRRRRGDSTA